MNSLFRRITGKPNFWGRKPRKTGHFIRARCSGFARNRLFPASKMQISLFFPCLTGKPNRCSQAKRRPLETGPDMARETARRMSVLRIGPRKTACFPGFAMILETGDQCWGWLAERVGFEPTIRGYRIHTFQACAFDHSATAPRASSWQRRPPKRGRWL